MNNGLKCIIMLIIIFIASAVILVWADDSSPMQKPIMHYTDNDISSILIKVTLNTSKDIHSVNFYCGDESNLNYRYDLDIVNYCFDIHEYDSIDGKMDRSGNTYMIKEKGSSCPLNDTMNNIASTISNNGALDIYFASNCTLISLGDEITHRCDLNKTTIYLKNVDYSIYNYSDDGYHDDICGVVVDYGEYEI